MKRVILSFFLIVLADSARLEAHAFLKDAEPGVGSTVKTPPNEVRIRFTENIELAFSRVQVFDPSGNEVDKRDVHLGPLRPRDAACFSVDRFPGKPAEDTHIKSVLICPCVVASRGHWSAQVSAEFPVLIDNTALQAVPNYRLCGGISSYFWG
jgi:hypothetical protein